MTDAPRQMDEPRKGHRYLVALVVALVGVALVAAALLWRYVPPREGTMNGVRSAIASFRAAEAPTLPAAAEELAALVRAVAPGQLTTPEALGHREYFLMYKHQDTPALEAGCHA